MRRAAILIAMVLPVLFVKTCPAGGPRWVAGTSYFNPGLAGHPLVWADGVLSYYTDLGPLSATVSNTQAGAMVATAAAAWSGIPTAAVAINAAGSLSEDVNGTNFFNGSSGLTEPADVQSTAIEKPLGIIYDTDGSVLNALQGAGASDPSSCVTNGVTTLTDNYAAAGTFAHALMIVNGLCASDQGHIAVLQYQLMRGFGRVLGLDWSQANDQMFPANITADGLAGWPLMHPVEKLCTSNGSPCMTGTPGPRTDDIAALNRLYPVTSANQANFPGKSVTAAATISIHGTIRFRNGQGMQGVNVVARPLIAGTELPDMRYPASALSGALFTGSAGNAVTGPADESGMPDSEWGGTDAVLEGEYDLSGIPLPPGVTTADYQLTLEAVNPLYTGTESVGPYTLSQVHPSGTMPVIIVHGMSAGSSVEQDVTIENSGGVEGSGDDGTESSPATVPVNGEWMARINGYGHTGWFRRHLRGGRQATIELQAVDEAGAPTENKSRLLVGIWNGTDPVTAAPAVDTIEPFNAAPAGMTAINFETGGDGDIRIGVADQRGDGRPDYAYFGRLLYADTVTPERIGAGGGPITIDGVGFRPGNTVLVNGIAAQVTSLGPTEITAMAPAGKGATGNVDVKVSDPETQGWTTIEGVLSYDAQNTDSIRVITLPPTVMGIGAPAPFTVGTVAGDGTTPAGGITVNFAVTNGSANLGCGQPVCSVISSGDGIATVMLSANSTAPARITASLANGASVSAEFTGSAPPAIAAVSSTLFLVAGATFGWKPQALVLRAGAPYPGQQVTWSSSSGAIVQTNSVSDANGMASTQVTAGPLAPNGNATVSACVAGGGSSGCAQFLIASIHPEAALLFAVSGTGQSLSASGTPSPVVLRVEDAVRDPIAGATVAIFETLRAWTPHCSRQVRCPEGPVLATQKLELTSAADGTISLAPLQSAGLPTLLDVLAVTGDAGRLEFSIEQHP